MHISLVRKTQLILDKLRRNDYALFSGRLLEVAVSMLRCITRLNNKKS